MRESLKASASVALQLLVILVCLGSPASAHLGTRALYDPEGREYALKILEAMDSADKGGNSEAIARLVTENPNLARRAVVAIIDLAREDQEAGQAELSKGKWDRAVLLAGLIEEKLADPQPRKLLRSDISLLEVIAYLDTLRPPLPPGYYFADRSHVDALDARWFNCLFPILECGIRLGMARTLENFSTLIGELDSLEPAVAEAQQQLAQAGLPALTEQQLGEIRANAQSLRLFAMAEMGLLQDFETELTRVCAQAKPSPTLARAWLAGFRGASRQRRLDKARGYLAKARNMASASALPDPVLEYALASADYRLRRLEGYKPDEKQAFAEFHKAWSALDGYQPLVLIEADLSWYDGRLASAEWVDELKHYEGYQQTATAVTEQLRTWIQTPVLKRLSQDLQGDQGFLQQYEFNAMLSAIVALNGQLITWSEGLDMEYSRDRLLTFVEKMDATAAAWLGAERTRGGLLDQYRARAAYYDGILRDDSARLVEAAAISSRVESTDFAIDYLLGSAYHLAKREKLEQAEAVWQQALQLADKLSLPMVSLESSSALARSYDRQENWAAAARYAQKTMDTLQTAAPLLGASGPQAQSLAQLSREMVDILARAAVHTGKPAQALDAISRGKELQAAALEMEGQPQVRAQAAELQNREQQVAVLSQQVERLEAMPASPTRDTFLSGSQTLLADTRAKFLADTRALRQEHSDVYSRVLKFDPLNLPDVQKAMPEDLAVVQYFPTEEALYIFVVTSRDFRLRQVTVGKQSLEASVLAYVRAIRRAADPDPVVKSEGESLYRLLIAPVLEDIAQARTLVLIPTGRLNSLPFASLSDASGVPLVESRRLLELAKPGDLGPGHDPASGLRDVVAFANATGDLPAAAREGEQVANLFPGAQLFSGSQATKDQFLKNGGHAGILHLATHGEWNSEDSLRNYLAMAGNEKVSQDEIFTLDLSQTSLVILSACNSAMGDGGEVGYVASLAEAFWIAGSHSVIASLWSVNDQSTSLLMIEFYKHLKAGDSKAEALRQAQLTVRAMPQYRHPYHWAGFVLFGEWR